MAGSAPYPLAIEIVSGRATFAYDGEMRPADPAQPFAGRIRAKGRDVWDLRDLAGVSLPHTKPYEITAKADAARGRLARGRHRGPRGRVRHTRRVVAGRARRPRLPAGEARFEAAGPCRPRRAGRRAAAEARRREKGRSRRPRGAVRSTRPQSLRCGRVDRSRALPARRAAAARQGARARGARSWSPHHRSTRLRRRAGDGRDPVTDRRAAPADDRERGRALRALAPLGTAAARRRRRGRHRCHRRPRHAHQPRRHVA